MKIGIVLLSMLLANGREPASMEHADLEDFKRRIGIDALVTKLPQEGIRADWSTLPLVISRHTKGMKLHYHDVAPLAGGLGIGSWTWRSKDAELVIKAA